MEKRELLAIAQSPIFKNIEITLLQKILESHQPNIRNYKKNEIVWLQDQRLDKLIIVIDGKLKAQMASDDGKVINMEEFISYEPVAVPVLLSKDQILPVTIHALVDTEIFCLSKEMLLKCCMANQTILENTMSIMSSKMEFLSRKIKFLQLHNIKQKIASTLLRLSENEGNLTFRLKLTKEELAKEMAITRPSLSREFSNLVQSGIISQDKDEISILDPEKLKNYK